MYRIDMSKRDALLTKYSALWGNGGLMFTLFMLSLLGTVLEVIAVCYGASSFFLAMVVVPVVVYMVNNKAEDTRNTNTVSDYYGKKATTIYNSLSDIYKIAAEPIVIRIYQIEAAAKNKTGTISHTSPEHAALRKRLAVLERLRNKYYEEINGPIDDSDLIGANMTLGIDSK